MSNRKLASLCAAFVLGGCTLTAAPNAEPTFSSTVAAEQSVVTDLQQDHANQNRTLRLLSRGTYECGNSTRKAIATTGNAPLASVAKSDTQSDDATTAALKLLDAYQQTIAAIAAKAQAKQTADQAVFTYAQNAVAGLGSFLPAALPFTATASAAISVIATIATDASIAITNEQMKKYANDMQNVLAAAVDTLEKNYGAFSAQGELAFQAWDSCARETFYYLRDVNSSDGIKLQNGTRMPSFVAPSTGVEMKTAWEAYRKSRSDYRGRLVTQKTYNAQLDAVVAQNAAIAKGQALDISATATAISDLAGKAKTACQDFRKAANQPVPGVCS